MSERYPGALITKTPVTPAGPYQTSAAPGVWTLDQQMQYQKQGVWPTAGLSPNYIEDVFSTYLYTGTGATQTITNGIDLSTKGGLVWLKDRTSAYSNILTDTARGATKVISSDGTYAQSTYPTMLTAFNSNGFSLGSSTTTNQSGDNYASWSFREQPKFFDIVTYTGTGSNTTIAHNLGSTPGCIIVKRLDITSDWQVYHSGLTSAAYSIQLNLTSAQASAPTVWNSTAPTSSVFSVGTSTAVNASGGTYVAYLFASNAGGFGAAGTDNVITCGSFTTDASSLATVNLGYEPQMVIVKAVSTSSNWFMFDNMRGWSYSSARNINANTNAAETDQGANLMFPTATGFQVGGSGGTWLASSSSFIYIAIRRGPMKTPTDATKVFNTNINVGATPITLTTGFTVDMQIGTTPDSTLNNAVVSRLQGVDTVGASVGGSSFSTPVLRTYSTSVESSLPGFSSTWTNTSFNSPSAYSNAGASSAYFWSFSRAPGFFDEVCYTGTGPSQTINHNLGVAPEMIIGKQRDGTYPGQVWQKDLGFYSGSATYGLYLFSSSGNSAKVSSNAFGGSPTATTFTATTTETASSGNTFVAYLFATCPGVSKVGSYTGTGATQTVDCGFTGGARFVLIKRTDSTGDWYVWDTARGMVAGTDPSLLLNSTAAEVNANSVYTATTGFQIVSTAAGINASGGTYIFLAIA